MVRVLILRQRATHEARQRTQEKVAHPHILPMCHGIKKPCRGSALRLIPDRVSKWQQVKG